MLIFGGFPHRQQAEAFLKEVKQRFPNHGPTQAELDECAPANFGPFMVAVAPAHGIVCDSLDEMDRYEVFPFHVDAPIVLIHREWNDDEGNFRNEREIEELVTEFGGRFFGT